MFTAPPDEGHRDEEPKSSRGVQSLEIGIDVLKVLVESGSALMLKEIAAAADMLPSKVHRYLVSLVRSGPGRTQADRRRSFPAPGIVTLNDSKLFDVPQNLYLLTADCIGLADSRCQA